MGLIQSTNLNHEFKMLIVVINSINWIEFHNV